VLALAAAFMLAVTACSGDDSEDTDAGDTTPAAADTTAAPDTTTADTAGGAETTTGDSEPAGDLLAYDESAQCGTEGYTGNIAGIEAVDELTVKFTLCSPDVAFPAKVAFSAFQIQSSEYLESTGGSGDIIELPVGTGPYTLSAWERGSQIVLERNEDYWGDPALATTAVFRWNPEGAQRLVELQSGTADGIDNVGTDDFAAVEGDAALQLVERDPLNVFYVGFNVDQAPFDNELVRQAVAKAIDRDRLVANFYPKGSVAATQFLPPGIPGFDDTFTDTEYDPEAARALLTEAGMPDGFDVTLSLRDVARGYLPQPVPVATDIQAQLAEVGINVTLDVQESGTFIDNANAGTLPFYLLGWGADYPDATNFMDFHFGRGASPQFGTGFPDVQDKIAEAAALTDQAERDVLYAEVNALLAEHVPMVPIAYGGSAVAYKAEVTGAHASPLSNESLAVMGIEGQDQFTFVQNGEPSGLWCADETDGEALRVCEQIGESLLAYEVGGTATVPSLAESYEPNEDLTEWTFSLRSGVTFHDGTAFDANDVVNTYRAQWDAADPRHVGRTGDFTYFSALFGGFLNPPPAEG
jgi:ABC-type transport system substrate-binding protein